MGWLLPVGTPAGICSGLDGAPDGSGFVALGDERLNLDPDLYRLWRAAGAAPQVDELLAWAATSEILDGGDQIASLVDARLLVKERQGVEDQIGELAIRLTGECVGNGLAQSTSFAVLGRYGAQVSVDPYSNEVLLRSDGVTPIAVICEQLEDGRSHPPGFCLEMLIAALPLLVRAGSIRLEKRAGA